MKRSFLAATGPAVLTAPALSAERVSFQLGEFERSLSISELAGFAAGDPPAPELREALNQSAPVNAVMASNDLGTVLGKQPSNNLRS